MAQKVAPRREIEIVPLKAPVKSPEKVPSTPKREKVPANEG